MHETDSLIADPIRPADSPQPAIPLSPAQSGIWFVQKLLGDSPAFNVCQAIRLSGPLDRPALGRALQQLVARHPSLRTAFMEQHGLPVQFVREDIQADYLELDAPAGSGTDELEHLLHQLAAAPFDLGQAPLLRARLIKVGDDEHVFVLIVHHLVFDGWSARLLVEDLSQLYRGAPQSGGTPAPIAYSAHVHELAARAESGDLARSLGYWRQQLEGFAPLLLPVDHARSSEPGSSGRLLRFDISGTTDGDLRALAARFSCTSYMLLLAVYALVLRDYCGTDDVGVASPLAGRTDPRFGRTIGLFANTLILRTQLSGELHFGDIARRVRSTVLAAVKNQGVPYDSIARELGLMRQTSAEAPFSVGFSFQDAADTKLRLEGLASARLPLISGATRCDLWLTVIEDNGRFSGEIEYDGRLFEAATVAALARHFQDWLQAVCRDPATRIDALRFGGDHQPRDTLWPHAADYRRPGGTLQLFLAQVARAPDATAVISGGRSLSYREVDALSNRLAGELLRRGVTSEQPVAVLMDRSATVVVALLAVLKSGGVYFPIDVEHPPERRAFMLRDSAARLLLTDDTGRAAPDIPGLQAMAIADVRELERLPDHAMPHIDIPATDAAYLIYTSGSTGEPRGVINLHGGLTNHILWLLDVLGMDARDRLLFKTSIGFDPSIQELLAPLCSGGTVVVAEPGGHRDAAYLVRTVRETAITIIQTVPSALRALLSAPDAGTMTSLRYIVCGGEVLPVELAQHAATLLPGAQLGNFYGPTEASCDATFQPHDGSVDAAGHVPIGRPIANARAYVMPPGGAPRQLPPGAIGELCIGGAGLARGYLRQPDLTAMRFPADPFIVGARIYRTGDLVRRRSDGALEYIGRTDNQIKLRGFRIDPGEIEAAMRAVPQVSDCVTMVVNVSGAGEQLVAFYTGTALPARQLGNQLRSRLPPHMLPNAFVPVPAFPLLPGGKVDRLALAAGGGPGTEVDAPTAPRSPLEEAVWTIWREVLPAYRFGVHDNFFELGGHSLLATQVVSRVRGTLGVDVPIRGFLEKPTIADLAALVATGGGGPDTAQDIPSLPRLADQDNEFPVSFSQRRMWFVQAYDPGTTAYNMPFALRLLGPLDLDALDAAFGAVARRHEAFRTTFPLRDGEPVQRIAPLPPRSPLIIRSFDDSPDAGNAIAGWFREETLKPFDLTQGPLHRIFVARVSAQEHAVLWLVHHVIGDQWSAGILFNELLSLYQGLVARKPVRLPELPIQYADFAVWQRQRLDAAFLEPQLAYWRAQLQGIQPLNFPSTRSTPHRGGPVGAVEFGVIPAELLGRLRAFSAERGATPYMTLLAAFNVLLSRFTGQTDIAVGSPIANRHHRQAEQLVGTLVNTLVMRTDLSGDPSFAQLLERVRGVALDGYMHQDTPFERLVEEHGATLGGTRTPLVQVLFNVVNAIGAIPRIESLQLLPVEFDPGSTQFDLSLSVGTGGDTGVAGRMALSYSTRLFDAESMRRFVERYVLILSRVVAEPELPISRLDILLEGERRQVAVWNDTRADYPATQRVDQLFAAQVEANPRRIAVEGSGSILTYRDLDVQARTLAAALQARGAGPGKVIGIYLERTPALLAALLAVMRTGAAYVPLDPSFPMERLQFMVADAGVLLLLSHSSLRAGTHFGVDCVELDKVEAAPGAGATTHAGDPDDLAYVLYTSGSTGRPKGVEIPHRALTNLLWSMRREPGCNADDKLLAITTLSFDISGLELYLPLICGGTVVLASTEEARDGRLLQRCFQRHAPTMMQATPSTWRMLIATGWAGAPRLRILCGGEPLPPDLARGLLERCAELWNVYGPTETTIWSTAARITDADDIHIGLPIANTTVCILGPNLETTPPGWIGELCIGGDGLARGYRKRAELTAQRFVHSPLAGITGDMLYRTGDLARRLPDGRLVHLGRSDFQVKIRGYRIELGDIESTLMSVAAPAQAVVAARDDAAGQKQLVAYLVPRDNQSFDVALLRQRLREHLPDYMIPAFIVTLPSLPLTANRKIDVGALPNPSADMAANARRSVSPRGRLEVQLTALWRQILNDDSVGVEDNFFERGGHSLLAVQLASQIEKVTGVQMPLATLFEAPTVASMARLLTSGRWNPSWRSLVAIQSLGSKPPLFMVPGVGGNVLMFAGLARRLGLDQPVYGLQARGLDNAATPFTSIVRMARHYIHEMQSVRPRGPWFIAGACTGGVVAYEMARQLRNRGEAVQLVLLDAWHPASAVPPRPGYRALVLFKLLVRKGLQLAGTALSASPAQWWRLARTLAGTGWRAAEWPQLRQSGDLAYIHQSRVAAATWIAVSRYRPPPARGNLLHIIASRRRIAAGVADTRPMWQALVAGETRSVPVAAPDSGQLFVAPHVDEVAELLRDYLARALPPDSAPVQR